MVVLVSYQWYRRGHDQSPLKPQSVVFVNFFYRKISSVCAYWQGVEFLFSDNSVYSLPHGDATEIQ
jgi:hypothetical protein